MNLTQSSKFYNSLHFYLRHCVRSTYYTSFIKCNDKYCVHCSRYPIRATRTISLLRAGGGYIPWPTMTYSNKHYDTFLQRAYSILSGEKICIQMNICYQAERSDVQNVNYHTYFYQKQMKKDIINGYMRQNQNSKDLQLKLMKS